jgi:hypothetical protein
MATKTLYTKDQTALLFVDPYNDFLSEGGKIWPRVKDVATEVGLLDNLRTVVSAIRQAGIQVFIVPHRRWEPGDYEEWQFPNPTQEQLKSRHSFARGNGVGNGIPILRQRMGISLSRSIGRRTGLLIRTWNFA